MPLLPLLLSPPPARSRALRTAARLIAQQLAQHSSTTAAAQAAQAAAGLPPQVLRTFGEWPVALGVVAGAGRALVARAPVAQGTILLEEWPLAAAPSPEFAGRQCYHCLAPMADAQRESDEAVSFCGDACLAAAEKQYLRVERRAGGGAGGAPFAALREHCLREGERFPLVAARLACSVLQAWPPPEDESKGGGSGGGSISSSVAAANAAALCSVGPMPAVAYLCHVAASGDNDNDKSPLPPAWRRPHALLAEALASLLEGEGGGSSRAPASSAVRAVSSPSWYAFVLSRLHLNSFRVESAATAGDGGLLAAAADSSSSSFAAALLRAATAPPASRALGSAVYAAASLANHSCDPTADATWPPPPRGGGSGAAGTASSRIRLTARRDLSPGEEATITYIDASLDVKERRQLLLHNYGFFCKCARCREEAAAQ
jgi:hypothetical protein